MKKNQIFLRRGRKITLSPQQLPEPRITEEKPAKITKKKAKIRPAASSRSPKGPKQKSANLLDRVDNEKEREARMLYLVLVER